MNWFLVKYPKILKWFYPKRITSLHVPKTLFLTFDDGPIPEITPWVLAKLSKYNAKTTFFCIGDNIRKNPDIFQQIIAEGHSIGNHTFNHLNGWQTSKKKYVENVVMAEAVMLETGFREGLAKETGIKNQESREKRQEANLRKPVKNQKPQTTNAKLFRPPYGKIKNSQATALVNSGYKIVMWDVLSGDFSNNVSAENCYKNVVKNAKEGSIIVFHDSLKASENLKYALPKVLKYYSEKGFQFKSL